MQFHMTKVLLYEPFAFYHRSSEAATPNGNTTTGQLTMAQIAVRCRALGNASAIKVAKLFETFRRKHDIRYLQSSCTQYAATAAHFLVKHLPFLQPDELVEPEAYLRSLTRTLSIMVKTFKPAVKPLEEARDALRSLERRID
jgi:hypothetical protein